MDRPRLIDRRDALGGRPGTHALIIGISGYRHLPPFGHAAEPVGAKMDPTLSLTGQTVAAFSAFTVFKWLRENCERLVPPLATCRLMLAASDEELEKHDDLKKCVASLAGEDGRPPRCDVTTFLAQVNAWREDASVRKDDSTFFYFAGNGFEIEANDPLIVLDDFGSGIGPLLRATCRVEELYRGMSPASNDHQIARTQLYFVDTDRDPSFPLPPSLRRGTTVPFDLGPTSLDDRSAIICYATSPGRQAIALKSEGTLFSNALVRSLGRFSGVRRIDQSGQARWCVTVASLADRLPRLVRKLAERINLQQEVKFSGTIRDATVVQLDGPPPVRVRVELDPAEAAESAKIKALDLERDTPIAFERDLPSGLFQPATKDGNLPSGMYRLTVSFDPPEQRFHNMERVVQADAIEPLWKFEVTKN